MVNTHLLIIDPQNDFCDLPEEYCPQPRGGQHTVPSLPVRGAHADMQRLAAFIDGYQSQLNAITITLDSHQHLDVAHPTFWQQSDGSAVAPFTQISAASVREGRFCPRQSAALPRTLAYLEALEASARYVHMVWPVHCEIGSWGHNVHADVKAAYNRWEEAHLAIVDKVCKGTNPWTEHYSAIRAEVPDAEDQTTQSNRALLARLKSAERVLIAGEAGSHCVRATVEDMVEQAFADDAQRLVLLTDCMSPVTGFDGQYQEFLAAMRSRGVKTSTSAATLAERL